MQNSNQKNYQIQFNKILRLITVWDIVPSPVTAQL